MKGAYGPLATVHLLYTATSATLNHLGVYT